MWVFAAARQKGGVAEATSTRRDNAGVVAWSASLAAQQISKPPQFPAPGAERATQRRRVGVGMGTMVVRGVRTNWVVRSVREAA